MSNSSSSMEIITQANEWTSPFSLCWLHGLFMASVSYNEIRRRRGRKISPPWLFCKEKLLDQTNRTTMDADVDENPIIIYRYKRPTNDTQQHLARAPGVSNTAAAAKLLLLLWRLKLHVPKYN